MATLSATVRIVSGSVETHDGVAELPRVFLNTTFSMPAGSHYTVKTSGGNYTPAQFQQCLNDAATNGIQKIVIDDGLTIDTTSGFTLPAKNWDGWTYIMSASVHAGTFPKAPGKRVAPADASSMARIRATAANAGCIHALNQAGPAKKYRLVGLEFTCTAGQEGGLVQWGDNWPNGSTDTSRIPEWMVVDRCYLHANPTGSGWSRRGIFMDARSSACVDSYIAGMRDPGGNDSQAISHIRTVGPLKITNNYLQALTMPWMSGGSPSAMTPADIEIRYNHIHKDPAWEGVLSPSKHLMEFKFCERVLVEGNVMENTWGGQALGIFSISNGGPTTAVLTRDIVVRNNKVSNVYGHLGFSFHDYTPNSLTRVVVRNNLFVSRDGDFGTGAKRTCNVMGTWLERVGFNEFPRGERRPGKVELHNNTFDCGNPSDPYFTFVCGPEQADAVLAKGEMFHMTGNILTGPGPLAADGSWTTSLAAMWDDPDYRYNHAWGSTSGIHTTHGATNTSAADRNAVLFTNPGAGDYSLQGGSPFKGLGVGGADPGVNMTTLNGVTQYTVSGQRPSEG